MATTLMDSVIHYRKKLDKNPDDEVTLNVIHKLSKIPITLEILEATHIGKYIRKLSKRHDLVGSKAKVVLNKWRDIFANSVSDKNSKSHCASKKENVNKSITSSKHVYVSEVKTVNNHKEASHEHKHKHKNSSHNNASEQSPKKHLNGTSPVKEKNSIETSHSIYNYEAKKESHLKYKDYDPHAEVSEGYNPECPELFPSEGKTTKTKKVVLDTYEPTLKRKHGKISDESDAEKAKSHSKKSKHTNHSTSDSVLDSFSESKPLEKKDKQTSHKEKSISRTNNSHSMNEKSSTDVKSDKDRASKPKSSSDSKKAKSKGSGDSSSEKSDKLIKKTKNVPIHSSEEFTSSNVTFEACLGLNDIVSFKKKRHPASKPLKSLPPSSTLSSSSSTKKSSVNENKKMDTPKRTAHVKKDSPSASKVKAHKESSDKEKLVFEAPMPPKIKLQVSDITSTLPEIQPHYRPLPRTSDFYSPKKKEAMSNEEAIMFTTSRREKTAVYSGRRNNFYTSVPTLVSACTRILLENIDDIECVGDLPYELFRPILERCTPLQLMNLENFNPEVIEKTGEFWLIHCKRDYKLLKPLEHETWRDLYLRASDERERKLKSITASISANISKSNPARQVKLAYVDSTAKPPRDVARRQAKNGTAVPVSVPIKTGPPSKSTPRPTAPAVNSARSSPVERPSFVNKKPKVAPLMAKTLKSMKQCFRR